MSYTYKDNTDEVLSALEKAKKRGLEAIGLVAEGHAKKITPVDTGRLRNSISHATDDEAAYIGTNVEYAPYVELGARGRKGQRWKTHAPKSSHGTHRRIQAADGR